MLMDPRVQQPPPLCSNQAQACFKALQMRCFVLGEGQKCQGVAMEGGGKKKSHLMNFNYPSPPIFMLPQPHLSHGKRCILRRTVLKFKKEEMGTLLK